MKKIKVIIIHGNHGGTGEDAWIPWLKVELESRGFLVQNPTMPDNYEAKSSIWLPYIEKDLGADEQTILVGWSSGAVAAMRYAETHRILGSVLIGVCYTDTGSKLEKKSGYYDEAWQWEKIQQNQQWIVQFGSTDDPVIPPEESRFVHEKLQTEYVEFQDKGHFGWPKPMLTFPELLDAISRLCQ
jgi:predicted alpha/beta hydrolase family esterase